MGKTSYLVLGGGVNRRNERSIGGIKLVGPPLCKAFRNAYVMNLKVETT